MLGLFKERICQFFDYWQSPLRQHRKECNIILDRQNASEALRKRTQEFYSWRLVPNIYEEARQHSLHVYGQYLREYDTWAPKIPPMKRQAFETLMVEIFSPTSLWALEYILRPSAVEVAARVLIKDRSHRFVQYKTMSTFLSDFCSSIGEVRSHDPTKINTMTPLEMHTTIHPEYVANGIVSLMEARIIRVISNNIAMKWRYNTTSENFVPTIYQALSEYFDYCGMPPKGTCPFMIVPTLYREQLLLPNCEYYEATSNALLMYDNVPIDVYYSDELVTDKAIIIGVNEVGHNPMICRVNAAPNINHIPRIDYEAGGIYYNRVGLNMRVECIIDGCGDVVEPPYMLIKILDK